MTFRTALGGSLLVLAVGGTTVGCSAPEASHSLEPPSTAEPAVLYRPADADTGWTVTHVRDGDTLVVQRANHSQVIRLIGVDTPEIKDPRKPPECYGREASRFTTRATLGTTVALEFDTIAGRYDRYHRTLAYVWLDEQQMLNQRLVRDGYAREYDYRDQPYTYRPQFRMAQNQATQQHNGLWGECSRN